ncbi:MAG: polysaccharide biosynthesis protein [Opitutaceae bacterium]
MIALYGSAGLVSYWLSWKLRFGFYAGIDGIPERFQDVVAIQGLWILTFKMVCLYALGQFTGLLRFFRLPDAIRLFVGSSIATAVLLAIWVVSSFQYVPPASILLTDFILFTFSVMGLRVGIRILDERRKGFFRSGKKLERVAIVGAGQAGSALVSELISQPELGMRPVTFFDDSSVKHGRQLHGIPIAGAPEKIPSFFATHDLDKVILAMPSASPERLRALVSLLKQHNIPVETVPSVREIISGSFRASQTREVNIEDLLYREPIEINFDEIREFISGQNVMVTGAGGSVGQELSQQVASMKPKSVLLVDRCESALFLTERKLAGVDIDVVTRVADVKDVEALEALVREFAPNAIYHAAAHKHVGMMERQPREAFLNNSDATYRFAQLAVKHSVASFCLISTDKAVYPSSVMGATKRLAELSIQSLIASKQTGSTRFSIVRFGNVIGSSGSVIPIFEKQIDQGGPVTVTDRNMTRYFMTIPEAVGLVLLASSFKEAHALYVLDMGQPVKIDDVARDLIRLKGLEPDVDIDVTYIGARPGEKIDEVLQYSEEALLATAHPKILRLASEAMKVVDKDHLDARFGSLRKRGADKLLVAERDLVFSLLNEVDLNPEANTSEPQSFVK